MKNDPRIEKLLQKMQSQEKYIASICAAPTILLKADILKDRSMTCHLYVQSQFDAYLDKKVVVDGKVITSQIPGAAMEFALKLVEILFGIERMKKVNAVIFAQI